MVKQKGICEECKKEYEYDYNPKFPRKYCFECSAKKKAEFENRPAETSAEVKPERIKQEVEMGTTPYKGRPENNSRDVMMLTSYAKDLMVDAKHIKYSAQEAADIILKLHKIISEGI